MTDQSQKGQGAARDNGIQQVKEPNMALARIWGRMMALCAREYISRVESSTDGWTGNRIIADGGRRRLRFISFRRNERNERRRRVT